MQLHLKLQVVYVCIHISLCLTDSLWSVSVKVLEEKIIVNKILRMLSFHPIAAFMKTYPNFKNFLVKGFRFKYISPIKFKTGILV